MPVNAYLKNAVQRPQEGFCLFQGEILNLLFFTACGRRHAPAGVIINDIPFNGQGKYRTDGCIYVFDGFYGIAALFSVLALHQELIIKPVKIGRLHF